MTVSFSSLPSMVRVCAPLLLIPLVSCSRREAAGPPAGRSGPVPVITTRVLKKDVPLLLPAIGSVQARTTVTVRPQVGGKLAEVHFTEGAFVQAGDLLFTIDRRPFEVALAEARAELEQAKAEAENASVREQRYDKLDNSGSISIELVEQVRTMAITARTKVTAAEASIQKASLDLEFCRITAPLSGRAGRLLVDPGNIVQANLTDLTVINEIQPIEVSFTLAGRHLAALREFSTAGGKPLEVTATPEGSQSIRETGTVAFFDNTVRPTSGTIEVRALFPNQTQALWPGQFTDVRLRLTETRAALTVPAKCIQTGQEGPYLYATGPDRTAVLRQVKIDRMFEGTALILEGVKEGEEVVLEGQNLLRPGSRVEVKNPPAQDVTPPALPSPDRTRPDPAATTLPARS